MSSLIAAALLFASGASALVYQALWVKQVGIVVGVDVYAVTAVVSAFFAGLAVGGLVLGKRADESPRPLLFYAWIELGVGVLGVATTLLLSWLPAPYAAIEDFVGRFAWIVAFVVVAIPAFLMGGTLPALLRAVRPRSGVIGAASGAFYAANTAGGVVGVLASPFLLIPGFGVRGAGFAAGAMNLLLAAAAVLLARRGFPLPATERAEDVLEVEPEARSVDVGRGVDVDADAAPQRAESRLGRILYAVAGGLALGFEVVWSQAVVQFINTRAFSFAAVLATYLTGLALGSALWSRFADRVRDPWRTFGLLEAGAGLTAIVCFWLLTPWLPALQAQITATLLPVAGPSLAAAATTAVAPPVLLLLPTLLLGAAFPAVARLTCGPEHIGRDIGAVTALNTLGGIVGTLLTGFLAVPVLGLSRTLGALAVGTSVVGGIAALHGSRSRYGELSARSVGAVAAGFALALVAALRVPQDHLAQLLVAQRRGGSLDFYEETAFGTVAVVREPLGQGVFHRLYIHGISNSADHMMSLRYMRLQALVPLLIHPGESKSALVVGLGTGITCGATLPWPTLERRVCAELVPGVAHAVGRFDGNFEVAIDPRVSIRIVDGRHLLLREETAWDVITLEPPPPIAAGVVNLYSSDFYELGRARLAPGGIMAQWFPLHPQDAEADRTLVRSFLDVFPHVSLWTTETHEMMLVGSNEPLEIDVPTLLARMAVPAVRRALEEVGIPDAASLLATYVTDRAGLEQFVRDAPPVTDDRPRLEYAALLQSYAVEFPSLLQELFAQQREPPLVGADEHLRAAIRTSRERLHLFYSAMTYVDVQQPDRAIPLLERVLAEEGANPYYRWVTALGVEP